MSTKTKMRKIRGYKVRLYPNDKQKQRLLQILGASRWVFNHFLEMRKNYYLKHKKTLSYRVMSRRLIRERNKTAWLKTVNSRPLEQSLRRLDSSYNNFFKKNSNFPRFRSKKDSKQSFQISKDWRATDNKILIEKGNLIRFRGTFPKEHRAILVISLDNGKWYASTFADIEIRKPKKFTKPIGIDLGLNSFATTSRGVKYPVLPEPSLKKEHQLLSRKLKGSRRRERAKKILSNKYQKVANRRRNHLHHLSKAIVSKNHAVIAVEDLAVKNMVGNHRLAKSIANASWGEFLRQLQYKQEAIGGKFVKIDRFFPSSKTCSKCGFVIDSLPLNIREWNCPRCGAKHDRDVNAARVILQQAEERLDAEGSKTDRKRGIPVEA